MSAEAHLFWPLLLLIVAAIIVTLYERFRGRRAPWFPGNYCEIGFTLMSGDQLRETLERLVDMGAR